MDLGRVNSVWDLLRGLLVEKFAGRTGLRDFQEGLLGCWEDADARNVSFTDCLLWRSVAHTSWDEMRASIRSCCSRIAASWAVAASTMLTTSAAMM